MPMYGCIGMKHIAEMCHTEDLCPKQQLIGITWSVTTKLVQKTSVLYKLFITFYSVTTNEGAKASCICGTTTEGARAAMLETEMKISPILLKLAFCSAVMVRLCSRIVMFPRLCSNAATRWAWNQTTQEEFVCSLPPKRSISAGILISPPSAWHCLLCKWCR